MNKVLVDSDTLDFLKYLYFGSNSNPYKSASRRAYLDMNRTIRFCNLDEEIREQIRNNVDVLLEKEIFLITQESRTMEEYDNWHYQLSSKIIMEYKKYHISFTYGQAQKWINMTMKYLYVLSPDVVEKNFNNLHIPIDTYVFRVAQKELKIDYPKKPWSRWESYDEYMAYQKLLREKIVNMAPLRWEFMFWLKEAKLN